MVVQQRGTATQLRNWGPLCDSVMSVACHLSPQKGSKWYEYTVGSNSSCLFYASLCDYIFFRVPPPFFPCATVSRPNIHNQLHFKVVRYLWSSAWPQEEEFFDHINVHKRIS